MTAKGTFEVRINGDLEGHVASLAVPVRIRRVDEEGRTRRGAGNTTIVAPMSRNPHASTREDVPAGHYELQAILPSGEVLTEVADIQAGETLPIALEASEAREGWRSWGHFTGINDASPASITLLKSALAPPQVKRDEWKFTATAGVDLVDGERQFRGRDWAAWYAYFERRAATLAAGDVPQVLKAQGDRDLDFTIGTNLGGPLAPSRIAFRLLPGFNEVADVGLVRPFVVIEGTYSTRVVSIPWPWWATEDQDRVFFELFVSQNEKQLFCEPVLRDSRAGGLFAYLNSGRAALAGELMSVARGALFEKQHNPLLAAVAGYVLLSTDASRNMKRWPDWLQNLSAWFPHLPDGPILRAKWLLERGGANRFEEAAVLLRAAHERGLPFFTAGVTWLIDGWRQLAAVDPHAEKTLAEIRTVARSIDFTRAITSLSIANPTKAKITLSKQRKR